MLICPKCHEALIKKEKQYECCNRHSFDIARQGYTNLSLKQKKETGDNKLMVQARTNFLEKDYYDFMRQFVKEKLSFYSISSFVDAGCGQGYYTKAFQEVVDVSYGIDLSKEAIRHASIHDKKSLYFVSSIFDMPFSKESIDGITSIFTPLPSQEVQRVLKKGGYWIIVGPGPNHCMELKEVVYDTPYQNEMPNYEFEGFECVSQDRISNKEHVNDVWSLFEMTPYRYHTNSKGLQRAKSCKELDCTFEFLVSVWRKL